MVNMGTSIVQITNVASAATHEQMQTLFSFLGEITDMQLFPKHCLPGNMGTKICFVKFQDLSSVGVARHLTNTVFIDRPLICAPYTEGAIPNEEVAITLIPPADSVSSIAGMQGAKIDPAKLDQMQRTIYVGNLDTKTATAEEVKDFFSSCGEIKNVKMAGDVTEPIRYCFVEFESVESIKSAMRKNGDKFQGRVIKINQSNNSVLTGGGGGDANSREIDEAMRRVRMAQSLISKALDPERARKKRSRSRSGSRSRRRHHRSRSRDRSRRRRSRSKGRRRSRSRSRDRRRSRRSRSRSKERRRKRSRSHKRSRSPSKKSSKSRHKDRKRDSDRKRSKHEKEENTSEDKAKKEEKPKEEEKSPEKPKQTETNGSIAMEAE